MSKLADVDAVPVAEAVVATETAMADQKTLYALKLGYARVYLRRTEVRSSRLIYDDFDKRFELFVSDFKGRSVMIAYDGSEELMRLCWDMVLAFTDGHTTFKGELFATPAVVGAVSRFEEVFGKPSFRERCLSWFS